MKTIRIDGRTYAAVEVDENTMCKGCIFYTVRWDMNTPRCAADEREDGKNVIFKLMANNVTEV